MSSQAISDFITKQVFIEKNIVTYRSLSRQFSLHVNAAKNELATYHHNAPYQSQNSCATFLISGTVKTMDPYRKDSYEDVDMDHTQGSDNVEERDGTEENDSDEVSQTTVLLVDEKDLEGAKAKYDLIHSVYVYSLAPAPLIDSALICDCTESVRKIDRSKGADWATTVGVVILSGIKTGPPKKGRPLVAPCVPGPSKSKPAPAPEPAATRPEPVKMEIKVKKTSSFVSISDMKKEKNNGTGKLNFFAKSKDKKDGKPPEDVKKVKKEESVVNLNNKMFFSKPDEKAEDKRNAKTPEDVKKVKKEESVVNLNKKMFFSKPDEKAAEITTSGASAKVEKGKGKKPSSRDDAQTTEKVFAAAGTVARRKGNIILSDDESDEEPVKRIVRRKSRASLKSDSSVAMDSEAERELRGLMDLDDDQVEIVSHAPSTAPSDFEDQSETDFVFVKIEQDDGDVDMADDSAAQSRPKKRKAKATIPVGRNGLKKRKIIRTKSREGDDGYFHKEDYTDWESVDDVEPEPEEKSKTKTKTKTVKKEFAKGDEKRPSATPEEVKNETTRKPEPGTKPAASRAKAKASGNVKTKKGLMNFFGPVKKT